MSDNPLVSALVLPRKSALKPYALTKGEKALLRDLVDVRDAESYQLAAERTKAIKAGAKRIESHFEALIAPLRQVTNMLRDWKTAALAPFTASLEEQESVRIAWRRQAEAEAREKAEAQRRADEEAARAAQKAQAEELQRQAEALKASLPQVADALRIEAASVEAAPLSVPLRAPVRAVPVTPGLSDVTYRSAKVENFGLLFAAVVAGKVPLDCLAVDQPFLNDRARKLGAAFESAYPGCKLVEIVASRTR